MKIVATALLMLLLLVSSVPAIQEKAPKAEEKPKTPKAHKPTPAPAAPVDDASITASVKERLSKTPSLKNETINAETKDGVVTLTGTVKTPGHKGVATNVTKACKGVKKVVNNITVEKGPAAPKEPKKAPKEPKN